MLRAALLLALPWTLAAQVICTLGPAASSYKTSSDESPSRDASELGQRAHAAAKTVCGTNCPEVVLFRNVTAPNLMLLLDAGRAKVVYAPQLLTAVYDRYGDAGVMALISHELGHALDDVLGASWVEKGWTPELRADGWAGCILSRINSTPQDLKDALAALQEHPSPAHPAWPARLSAIRSGYAHCGGTGDLK